MLFRSIAKYLISKGLQAHYQNNDLNTPLSLACYNGHFKVVKYLVENGAIINEKNKDLNTPLTLAAFKKHKDITEYLLIHGADPNVQNKIFFFFFSLMIKHVVYIG